VTTKQFSAKTAFHLVILKFNYSKLMAKSRKDLFEEQLRDLQKDISTLNQKLSTTATNDSGSSKMTTLLSGIRTICSHVHFVFSIIFVILSG
jgi:uncharacterized protein (DUF2461 family)